jgi:hypothetical protein
MNNIIKNIAKEKNADPTVVVLALLFPESFLCDVAKKNRCCQKRTQN